MHVNSDAADNSASPQKKLWLMSADEASNEQAGSSRYSENKNSKDVCQSSLMQILESQIIPNLLKANESASPFFSTDGLRTELPTEEEIAHFSALCIATNQDAPDIYVQSLMSEGLNSEAIFLHLFAPAARHLGFLWEDDLCDFTQVTIGLVRMQQLTLRLGIEFQEKRKLAMDGMRALFAPIPGSQHTFGVLMVSEFFRKEGWQVWMELGSSESTLLEAVAKDWFEVIGLSVGTEAQVDSLREIIRRIRGCSANRQVKILIGGPLLVLSPDLYKEVGADGASADAASAVDLARTLFSA
ncbi:MAG: cobalamin B12-binding domain-containing protein [Oxalobacteraceae bacterium]|jgi:methanogenic corrinoid protein MtbC1|nr:cobalamin B12-binding domain-containing protein [Oxalobacteraceae bacterium]